MRPSAVLCARVRFERKFVYHFVYQRTLQVELYRRADHRNCELESKALSSILWNAQAMVSLKSSPGSQNGTGLLQTVIAMKALQLGVLRPGMDSVAGGCWFICTFC